MPGVNADSQRVVRGRTPLPRPRCAPEDGPRPEAGARALLGRLVVPGAVLAAVAGAFAYVGAVDPNQPGHYPACPLLRFTGLYCPGCGGLRSAHAFVHGDLLTALRDNAPAVAGYLAFAVLWTLWAVRSIHGRPLRIEPRPVHLWTLGILFAAFAVVRNLPFGGWLHP
ncbi:DUF2752 domain-containing protein [Streptomyces sp. NPDC021356]|uniref:DUF2752 domain-containing protein n=1 Tax=Streptomyces sp. NPDC021356 TaxID=3154900 RepID=UPI0033FC6EC2